MAKVIEFYTDIPNFGSTLSARINTAFNTLGVVSYARRNGITLLFSRMLRERFGNVDVTFSTTSSALLVDYLGVGIESSNTNDWLRIADTMNKQSETITKTGTESDANTFDNDPTTNDEYRSYPFDTTASDVQSKTRSIVNGAESGESSHTKTYNVTDTHENNETNINDMYKTDSYIYNYLYNIIKYLLMNIRKNNTLCDPLTDDATLLELEF